MAEDKAPAQEFLNQALKEGALDDSYVGKCKLRPEIIITNPSRFCLSPFTTRPDILSMACSNGYVRVLCTVSA